MFSLKNAVVFALLLALLSGCAYVNIDPNSVSGKEARQIISDRLMLNLAIYGIGSTYPDPQIAIPAQQGLVITIITPDLIGIDEKVQYNKAQVEECADQVFLFSFFISTVLSPFVCTVTDPAINIPLVSRKL